MGIIPAPAHTCATHGNTELITGNRAARRARRLQSETWSAPRVAAAPAEEAVEAAAQDAAQDAADHLPAHLQPVQASFSKFGNSPALAGHRVIAKGPSEERAALFMRMRQTGQRLTDSERLKECGVLPVAGAGGVNLLHGGENNARFASLRTCKHVWACPVCSSRIGARRAAELAGMTRLHTAAGGAVAMMTLTTQHHHSERLQWLTEATRSAWSGFTSDKAWKGAKGIRRRYGVTLPPAWGLEVTTGQNGWHVHRHVLLFLDAALSADAVAAMQAEVHEVWTRKVLKEGMQAPHEVHGVDIRQAAPGDDDGAAALGAYLAKGPGAGVDAPLEALQDAEGLALESMLGATKNGRRGSRTPFEVLADIDAAYRAGDEPAAYDLSRWLEYVEYVVGASLRQVSVPGALKDAYPVEVVTEEEAAEGTEEAVEVRAIVFIPTPAWLEHLAYDLEKRAEVVEAAARGKTARQAQRRVRKVLKRLGVDHTLLNVDMAPGEPEGVPSHADALRRDLRAVALDAQPVLPVA